MKAVNEECLSGKSLWEFYQREFISFFIVISSYQCHAQFTLTCPKGRVCWRIKLSFGIWLVSRNWRSWTFCADCLSANTVFRTEYEYCVDELLAHWRSLQVVAQCNRSHGRTLISTCVVVLKWARNSLHILTCLQFDIPKNLYHTVTHGLRCNEAARSKAIAQCIRALRQIMGGLVVVG